MIVLSIAARELRGLFLSPLAWSILAVVQFILAYLFLVQIDTFTLIQPRLLGREGAPGVTDLVVAPLLANAGVILLLIAPLLTMRMISEERRSGSLSLLMSAPVSMAEIVVGKYLGMVAFFLIMLAMIAAMPLSLALGAELDLGKLAAGLLALGLLLASFAAVGLYMSALAPQPTIAAVSGFGVLLLLWILDWAGESEEQVSGLFRYLSMLRHYESLLKGLIDSQDIVYFLLVILAFLGLTVRHLEARRLNR